MVACASQYTLYDGSVIGADDSCVWDKQEFLNYLDISFYMTIYHNQQEFQKSAFKDERVISKTQASKIYTVTSQALWTQAYLNLISLEDEVDYLQLG